MADVNLGEPGYRIAKALEKKYQMRVNSLAERPDMTPDHPEYKAASDELLKIGGTIDTYEAENRVTDENGKVLKPPPTRLPVRYDPLADTKNYNYYFEPSTAEAKEALYKNPKLLQELDPSGGYSRVATQAGPTYAHMSDPMAPSSAAYRPQQTYLDQLSENDDLYDAYAERAWADALRDAVDRGEPIQRYKDIEWGEGKNIDYLAGGAEYNIDRRLAPLGVGVAKGMTLGMGPPLADAVGDLAEYELGKRGVDIDIPNSQDVINRSPGFALAGELGSYMIPGNPSNLVQGAASKALGYAGGAGSELLAGSLGSMASKKMGEELAKASISGAVGAGTNALEGGIGDVATNLNRGESPGDALMHAGGNVLPNMFSGAIGGSMFDLAGQGAGAAREGFRADPEMRAIKTVEDAGGKTEFIRGVVPPPEYKGYVRQSLRPGEPGSAAALASEGVAKDIDESMDVQARQLQQDIDKRKNEYFEHPAYKDRTVAGTPAVQGLVDLANEGWVAGPVTGAPRNMNMGQIGRIGKLIREYTDVPQIRPTEGAQAFAEQYGGVVVDGELGNKLYGLDESHAAPPGYSIVAVPLPMTAKNLTHLEELIDEELKMGSNKGRENDAVFQQFNRNIKSVRDQFPMWEDEAGNLVPPPGWSDPNAPRSPTEGPVYESEFVDSSRPGQPPTDIEPRGPDTEPMGGRRPPPAPPRLPPGGGLPPGETPLSLLAGNKLAMELPARTSHQGQQLYQKLARPNFPVGEQYQQFARELAFLQDVPRLDGDAIQEIEQLASNYDLGPRAYEHLQDALYPGQNRQFRGNPVKGALASGNKSPQAVGGYQPPASAGDQRGGLERLLDAGLDRPSMPELPVSEIEDAALRQAADKSEVARAWKANEGPTRQWFEDILAPGRSARSGETQRMMDLAEQQGAVEEAMGQINNIDRRLGPIDEAQKKSMLADLISKKLGREVTVEDLIRAGLIAGGVAGVVTSDDDENSPGRTLGAMAIAGGAGGGGRGSEPPKFPREPTAKLPNGDTVKGFSAFRQKQHEALSALETARRRVGANAAEPVKSRVMGYDQNPKMLDEDRALLEEAKKIGKEKELRTAAAVSVYPDLKKRAWFLGGKGLKKGSYEVANLHMDKPFEYFSGAERNPFNRAPAGRFEDMMRELFNLTAGRGGTRADPALKAIWEALTGEKKKEEEQPSP